MKLEYNKKKKKWIELPSGDKGGIYLDGFLKKKLDKVRDIVNKDWDAPILIDGPERSGKSTLAMTIGYYLSDTKLGPNNFASGLGDASRKIKDLPYKSVLIIDEGGLVFRSTDHANKEQRQLLKILDVVGVKGLTIIICLPSFFDLNKTIALRRSRFLIHVYTDNEWTRGRAVYFSNKKKKILYDLGKKNFGSYKKPKASFTFKFTDFKPEWYGEYLKIKEKSMIEALDLGKMEVNPSTILTKLMGKFRDNNPDIPHELIWKGFGVSKTEYYRRRKQYNEVLSQ